MRVRENSGDTHYKHLDSGACPTWNAMPKCTGHQAGSCMARSTRRRQMSSLQLSRGQSTLPWLRSLSLRYMQFVKTSCRKKRVQKQQKQQKQSKKSTGGKQGTKEVTEAARRTVKRMNERNIEWSKRRWYGEEKLEKKKKLLKKYITKNVAVRRLYQ